ncbi:TetR/AcrR family transcriptional regulator [Bradyrhizobium sp. 27S5]|uniref:TetR/AcrR family transcriptional regulator n=1 Tax=Bradyrhizobium sp. 27S5 TaxID=3139728 RepID=UPI0030CFE578
MTEQLSVKDWLDQGLKTLARTGFTALKAEPLAKVMGVSRGSFYWHFADIAAYRSAVLSYWREVAAEQVIAELETIPKGDEALALLLRRAFSARLALERAVRSWATVDAEARATVLEVDQRRIGYIETLLRQAGFPDDVARGRAQIFYWAFIGYALSEQALPKARQQAAIDELLRMAKR